MKTDYIQERISMIILVLNSPDSLLCFWLKFRLLHTSQYTCDVCNTTQRVPYVHGFWNTLGSHCTNVAVSLGMYPLSVYLFFFWAHSGDLKHFQGREVSVYFILTFQRPWTLKEKNSFSLEIKTHTCTKLKGRIIINETLICFEGTCKTIPFNSILEFSILSDFNMRNVIIWHWFMKSLVGTWRRNDVTSHRRQYDVMGLLGICPPLAPQYSKPYPPPQYSKTFYANVLNSVSRTLILQSIFLYQRIQFWRNPIFIYISTPVSCFVWPDKNKVFVCLFVNLNYLYLSTKTRDTGSFVRLSTLRHRELTVS